MYVILEIHKALALNKIPVNIKQYEYEEKN
jgi:hypothetical protein